MPLMFTRSIPLLIYIAVMVWLMTPEDDTKAARMYTLQRRIHWHRGRAEHHGRKVIALESEYAEVVA